MNVALPFVALLLGLKHAFDADHVVAVGNLLTRSRNVLHAFRLSLWWSAGHMVTASLLTATLFWGKTTFWPRLAERLDLLVPLMLLVIGAWGLLVASRRFHAHRHAHGSRQHAHLHFHVRNSHESRLMGGIGLVHGLASNDELLVILVAVLGVQTLGTALALVAIFSLGVVLGMAAYAVVLHWGVGEARRPQAAWWANVTFSSFSIVYAAYLFAGGSGLNVLNAVP